MNGKMMFVGAILAPALLATVPVYAGQSGQHIFTGSQYAKEARINLAEARRVALGSFRGKIVDQELEHEKGGSGLRYSFDIKRGNVTQEVGVDAKTGHVLENAREGLHPD